MYHLTSCVINIKMVSVYCLLYCRYQIEFDIFFYPYSYIYSLDFKYFKYYVIANIFDYDKNIVDIYYGYEMDTTAIKYKKAFYKVPNYSQPFKKNNIKMNTMYFMSFIKL